MQKPVVIITLWMAVGILAGYALPYFPLTIASLVVAFLAGAGILARIGKVRFRPALLGVIPLLFGAGFSLYSAVFFPDDHYIHGIPADVSKHAIVGKIVSPLKRDPGRIAFILDLTELDGAEVSGRMRVSTKDEQTDAGYGDIVRLSGRIYRPRGYQNPGGFDYPAHLALRDIYATAALGESDAIRIIRRGEGLFRSVQDWREQIRRSFRTSLKGEGSAILQAMVLGEDGDLTDRLRDRFMSAGVTHIISISGSHLGMLAILCFGLIRGLMLLIPEGLYHRLTLWSDPKKIAALLTVPLVIFYTLLAGGQVATVRSLIMILAALSALLLDRENGILTSLATAALLILIAGPHALFDISFQLSFISILVIGFVVTLWNDLGIARDTFMQRVRNSLLLLILISFSISVATGPLVIHYFNQVSFIGVLSNMIIVPFAGMIVLPIGLLSGILSLFMPSLPFAAAAQAVADAFIQVVSFFARFPFAEFHPASPSLFSLLVYAVFLIASARFVRTKLLFTFRPFESSSRISGMHQTIIVVAGIILILTAGFSLLPRREARLSFIDVGQGDSALIELASGRNILIDGGGTYDGRFDTGRRVVGPFLWNRGIRKIDLVILSHPHPDHLNGLPFILDKFDVAEVWSNGQAADSGSYREFARTIDEKGILWRIMEGTAKVERIGEATIRILHPENRYEPHGRRSVLENNSSLTIQILLGKSVFLFTGDIEADAESAVLESGRRLNCDLLKVPHHGSKNSNTEPFIRAASPGVAVISVGKGNRYHHPFDDVLERYGKAGARIYRTDRDGAVIVTLRNGKPRVVAWTSLLLQRVRLDDQGAWSAGERENWTRIWSRIRA